MQGQALSRCTLSNRLLLGAFIVFAAATALLLLGFRFELLVKLVCESCEESFWFFCFHPVTSGAISGQYL
jgi:hypothetical protein